VNRPMRVNGTPRAAHSAAKASPLPAGTARSNS
jgi:hypothetical protein